MRLLLDTHVWLWAISTPERLSSTARAAIEMPGNTRCISVASVWEAAIKVGLGRLDLGDSLGAVVEQTLTALRAVELPVERRHALRVGTLPSHHRDPFDRMLIAQALEDDAVLVTADEAIRRYDVPLLWAGT